MFEFDKCHSTWDKCVFFIVILDKYRSRMNVFKGGRLCLQSTQKKGCPAHITIREFVLYPDY